MKTIAATKAQTNFFSLLDEVVVTHEPIQITSKRGNAILISEDDWRSIQETVYLLSIPGMRESIRKGLATPVEECDRELEWWATGHWSLPNRLKTMPGNWHKPDFGQKLKRCWKSSTVTHFKIHHLLKNWLAI